jgi:branched-subunit amino acid aminotransferase/4-amino-4-deoxychorismate lyase
MWMESGQPWFWEEHLERLRATSAMLGLTPPLPQEVFAALPKAVGGSLRVRITVQPDKTLKTEAEPYEPPSEPWRLKPVPVDPDPDVVRFKTTSRGLYEAAADLLRGHDDALLVHSGGQVPAHEPVLETTIANIFFEIEGQIVTPSADLPLLPGIARGRILDRLEGAREAELCAEDVRSARACCVTNALFGAHPVETIDGWADYESDQLARRLMDVLRSSSQESV